MQHIYMQSTWSISIRGLQIREGGNGENWEGPQFDPVVRPVEPESLSSLGAREHLPIEARKNGLFYAMILDIFYVLLPETIFCITTWAK